MPSRTTRKKTNRAKTAYLTGGEVTNGSGAKGSFNALTSFEDLGLTEGGSFKINVGGTETDFEFTKDTTVSDFLNKLKDSGLNASFDEKNQRFFITKFLL